MVLRLDASWVPNNPIRMRCGPDAWIPRRLDRGNGNSESHGHSCVKKAGLDGAISSKDATKVNIVVQRKIRAVGH